MTPMIVACAVATILNCTDFKWNKHDKFTYERAKYVCLMEYNGGCVTKFIKTGERDYQVKCKRGNMRREDKCEQEYTKLFSETINTEGCTEIHITGDSETLETE